MNIYGALLVVFFAVTLLVYTLRFVTYMIGVVNPPAWMINMFHMLVFAVFVFVSSLVAAVFIRLRRR